MNINDLTIEQAKQLSSMFGGEQKITMFGGEQKITHPRFNGPVVAQFIGRFVFVCYLEIKDGYCYLRNVRNVRYWGGREDGLGGLAKNGRNSEDKIDVWPDQVIPLDKLGPVLYASMEHWA